MQFLLLAHIVEGTPDDRIAPLLKDESLRAWELHAAGLFRSLLSRTDKRGVVGMLEAADLAAATKAIESLPLVKAGVLATEIIPLKPYVGFERLFAKSA
jgi:uncharacterized protein (UPF0261 family)